MFFNILTGLVTDRLRSSKLVSIVQPIIPINSTAVRIEWELRVRVPPRTIDGFRICYRVSLDVDQPATESDPSPDVCPSEIVIRDGQVSRHVVGGLLRFTYYEFRIQPIIEGALGLESSSVSVRTLEDGRHFCVRIYSYVLLWVFSCH